MFARAPLSFHSALFSRPTFDSPLLALFQQSSLLLFNNFRTLSFSVSSLSPALPISSALLPEKQGGTPPLVQPIPRFSYEVRSFLSAASCRLPAVERRLPTNPFPCVSYAKTGGYPSWSYQSLRPNTSDPLPPQPASHPLPAFSPFTAHSQSCYRPFTHPSPSLVTIKPSQGINSYTMPIAPIRPTVHCYRCELPREIPS
jgi:hypothetical protein